MGLFLVLKASKHSNNININIVKSLQDNKISQIDLL